MRAFLNSEVNVRLTRHFDSFDYGTLFFEPHKTWVKPHRLDLLLKQVYGPRADKLDPHQRSLFEEPPTDSLPAFTAHEPDVITTTVKKHGHGRQKLLEQLQRETEIIGVPESVQQATGGAWQKIGEKLDDTPSSLFARRIVRPNVR